MKGTSRNVDWNRNGCSSSSEYDKYKFSSIMGTNRHEEFFKINMMETNCDLLSAHAPTFHKISAIRIQIILFHP